LIFRRGDIVTIAAPGDYGKPRPAVVIQNDALNEAGSEGIIVALMTSTLGAAPLLRLTVDAGLETGLARATQVMVDKLVTVRQSKVGSVIGRLPDADLVMLNRLLAFVIGLA